MTPYTIISCLESLLSSITPLEFVSPPRLNPLLVPIRQPSCGDCHGIVIRLYDTLGLFGIVADLVRQTGGKEKGCRNSGTISRQKLRKDGLVSPDMSRRDVGSTCYVIHKDLL